MADPSPESIIAQLGNGDPHALVIVAVPSHDRHNKAINNQEIWADATLEKFSELFGGATAFQTFKGVYRSETGMDLWDHPILIESYTEPARVMNTNVLRRFLDFLNRMKRDTDQEAVLLVIDSSRFFV